MLKMTEPIASTSEPAVEVSDNSTQVVKHALFEKQMSDAQQKRLDFLMRKAELFAHFVSDPQLGRKKGKKRLATTATQKPNDLNGKAKPKILFEITPKYINGEMRDYQIRGLNWLISLYENGINGILADEMGLGKTIQAISILGYLKFHERINGPFLVIGPKSTFQNWLNEFKRFCPDMKAVGLIGDKDARTAILNEMRDSDWDVCVTTYNMILSEKSRLNRYRWRYIVVDEAHRMKNDKSEFSKIMRYFQSTNRLLLTGTPLQNNLHELWALLNYLMPDVFASSDDFDTWFDSDDCLRGNDDIVKRLHSILKSFMLRRIKAEVEKSILPKIELKLFVGLTKIQRETYVKVLRKEVIRINGYGEETLKRLDMIMQELRKAANHPYLIDSIEPGPPYTTDEHLVNCCGKMMLLDKLLAKLKLQGSRVVLFSQFVIMLDILHDYLVWRGYGFHRLDGQTPYDQRAKDIEEFNTAGSKTFIYLISTRAGGLGINLASADTVIIYDSDWNPQSDFQAIDRVHRIGQTKQVRIFRLVTENTVDERIVQRADIKLRLDNIIIQQGQGVDKELTRMNKGLKRDMIRFGLDSILSTNQVDVNEIDIDAILKYGEKKTAEENEKLSKMGESKLRNMTLEEASSVSLFEFDGIDYRSERYRKANDDNVHNLRFSRTRTTLYYLDIHKLYPRELLDLCDAHRWLNMSVDTERKEKLLENGFENWTVGEYNSFRKTLKEFGSNTVSKLAETLPNKTLDEIEKYHAAFFERGPQALKSVNEFNKELKRKKSEEKWRKNIIALKWKISQYTVPERDLTFIGVEDSQYSSIQYDRYLVCELLKHDIIDDNIYSRTRAAGMSSENHPLYKFMLSHTLNQTRDRIQHLMSLIFCEYQNAIDKENNTIEVYMDGSPNKKPKLS